MDPLTLVFSAVVAGANAALKPTAQEAVKDAYECLKRKIKEKCSHVEVEALERDPGNEARQQLVKSDLGTAPGLADRDVLEKAMELLAAVKRYDPDAAEMAGITIADLEADGDIRIEDLEAQGPIAVQRMKSKNGITIKGARSAKPSKR